MLLKLIIYSVVLGILPLEASAEEAKATVEKKYFYEGEELINQGIQLMKVPYHIATNKGQPVTIVFDDGREAQLVTADKTYSLDVPITINEATCVEKYAPPKCSFRTDVGIASYILVWSKHPDKSKLGQKLTIPNNIFSEDVTDTFNDLGYFYSGLENLLPKTMVSKFIPENFLSIESYRLHCESYEFLQLSQGEDLKLREWSFESNEENAEIKRSQNMVRGSLLDLEFKPAKDNSYSLSKVGYGNMPARFSLVLMAVSDISGFNYQKNDKSCDISMTLGFSQVVEAITGYLGEVSKLPHQPVSFKNMDQLFYLGTVLNSEDSYFNNWLSESYGIPYELWRELRTLSLLGLYPKETSSDDVGEQPITKLELSNMKKVDDISKEIQ